MSKQPRDTFFVGMTVFSLIIVSPLWVPIWLIGWTAKKLGYKPFKEIGEAMIGKQLTMRDTLRYYYFGLLPATIWFAITGNDKWITKCIHKWNQFKRTLEKRS